MVGTYILYRYYVRYAMVIFFSVEIYSVDYQNLFNYHISGSGLISSIRSQIFTLDCLMSHKMDPLKPLLDVQGNMMKKYLMIQSCTFYKGKRVLV